MEQPKKPKKKFTASFGNNIMWMYALILALLAGVYFVGNKPSMKQLDTIDKFENAVKSGYVEKITVLTNKSIAVGDITSAGAEEIFSDYKLAPGEKPRIEVKIGNVQSFDKKIEEWKAEGWFKGEVAYEEASDYSHLLWSFGPMLLLVGVWIYFMRRMSSRGGDGPGGVFSVGKSKAQMFDKDSANKVTFKDVAGLNEAKTEIEEIVEFLKNPQRYTELGAKIPRGALLVGPPGTGKTLLAKAVAGEADVPFLSMSGSDFVEMFVGVGAARVRDLFKQAKEKAPCIVFIDEIDAVGRARGKNPNMGSNDERENTLNQLLTAMDGFSTNNGVICLAATNRADMLDKALLRPGRFDRQIYVDLPELTDREEIFQVHLRNIKCSSKLDVEQLARQTQGFSGADIANVCNEAALIAARNNKKEVEWSDFMSAIDRIVGGLEKKSRIITDEEKFSIATHEAGHATITWMTKYGNPLVKVTIVPRGRALGAAWYAPEERQIIPTQALLDTMCGLLGGRAAEDVFLGQVGTGASDDLEKCTKIARSLVLVYGMSDKLPNLNYNDSTGQDMGFTKPFSEKTAEDIDEEVKRIVNEQYERAKSILRQYAAQHNQIRDLLVENEVIFHDDVEKILGKRQWKSRTDEIIEINKKEEAKSAGLIESGKTEKAEDKPVNQKPDQPDSADDGDEDGTPPPFNK